MTHDSRAFRIWVDISCTFLPLLALLAVLMGWSRAVQLVLTVVFLAAVFGTRIALTDWSGRRSLRGLLRRRRTHRASRA